MNFALVDIKSAPQYLARLRELVNNVQGETDIDTVKKMAVDFFASAEEIRQDSRKRILLRLKSKEGVNEVTTYLSNLFLRGEYIYLKWLKNEDAEFLRECKRTDKASKNL